MRKYLHFFLSLGFLLFIIHFHIKAQCNYRVDLVDPSGQGWGGNTLTIYINGNPVLSGITLANGYGPESHYLTVNNGEIITSSYIGNSYYQNEYYVYDSNDSLIFSAGVGASTPAATANIGTAICTSCPVPISIAVSNITQTTAVLAWASGGSETKWQIEFGIAGFVQGLGSKINIDTNSYSFSSLQLNTVYDYYIRSICDTVIGDTGAWTNKHSFKTACDVSTLPFTELFTNYSVGSFPDCWDKSEYNWGIYNSSKAGGSPPEMRYYYYYNPNTPIFLKTPIIDATASDSLFLYFKQSVEQYYMCWATGLCNLSVLVSVDSGITWNPVWSKMITGSIPSEMITIDLNAYAGEKISIKWVMNVYQTACSLTYNKWCIDDVIVVDKIPSCLHPYNLKATNKTDHSVQLNWQGNGENLWQIEWDTTGFVPGTGNLVLTNAKPYVLDGLATSTNYDFYVRAICDTLSGDTSIWTGPLTFKSNCKVGLPYIEDFSTTQDFTIPVCWDRTHQNWFVDSYTWNHAGGTVPEIHFDNYSHLNDTFLLFSPIIDASSATSLYLSFKHSVTQVSNSYKLAVLATINGGITWDTLWSKVPTADIPPEIVSIDLSIYAGHEILLAWMFEGNSGNIYKWYIDDIKIDTIFECFKPSVLQANNITGFSADITWSSVNENLWQIKLTSSLGTVNIFNTNNKPITLNGLLPSTNYEFYVRAICDSIIGDTSYWSSPFYFTTLDTCLAPQNILLTGIGQHYAKFSWDSIQNNIIEWQIEWDTSGFVLGTGHQTSTYHYTYSFTGINANTNYEFYMKAVCLSFGGTSIWIGPIQFTTLDASINNPDKNSILEILPNPNNGLFNIRILSDMGNVALSILNIHGKVVYEKQLYNVKRGSVTEINLRNMAVGIYYLNINDGKAIIYKKLIIN